MKGIRPVLGFVLLFPAVLFLAAVVIRNLPRQEIASRAQWIVMWYAGRQWTLWTLLVLLPFVVLIIGGTALFKNRFETRRQLDRLPASVHSLENFCVSLMTFSAAGILLIVVLHMLAD